MVFFYGAFKHVFFDILELISVPVLLKSKVYFLAISINISVTMTSASSSSARSLFAESKQRLAERVQVNVNNISSLTRQIQRGSKSNELISKASREFAVTENLMVNSEENLKKMQLIAVHMGYQFENIQKSALMLTDIGEQVAAMKR